MSDFKKLSSWLCLSTMILASIARAEITIPAGTMTVMGQNLSVLDCPQAPTRRGYNIYAPDVSGLTDVCTQITPAPQCDCNESTYEQATTSMSHGLLSARQAWSDLIAAKTCNLLQIPRSQLSRQQFRPLLKDAQALTWGWPALLKQYLNAYQQLTQNPQGVLAWCQLQKEISSSRQLKQLLFDNLSSQDANMALSEKIKIYGLYVHLFGADQELAATLKQKLKDLLTLAENNDENEKSKAIWYAFYHLTFTIAEFTKLARPAAFIYRSPLPLSSRNALKILNHLKLEQDAKDELQKLWFELGDRELMSSYWLLEYANWLPLQDELVFPTIEDYLTRLENSPQIKINEIRSLLVIMSIKELSKDEWAEIANRSYALISKDQGSTFKHRSTRSIILTTLLDKHIPYDKISGIISYEILRDDTSAEDYLKTAKRIYAVEALAEDAKEAVTTQLITHQLEKLLAGKAGKYHHSKNIKLRRELLDFLKETTVTAQSMRYFVSIYFNFNAFEKITPQAVLEAAQSKSYSRADGKDFEAIKIIINKSKLPPQEKHQALRLLNSD